MARRFADLPTLKKCYVLSAAACLPGVVFLVFALNLTYGDGAWMPRPETPGSVMMAVLSAFQLLALFVATVFNVISAIRFAFIKAWQPIFKILGLFVLMVVSLVPWGMIGSAM